MESIERWRQRTIVILSGYSVIFCLLGILNVGGIQHPVLFDLLFVFWNHWIFILLAPWLLWGILVVSQMIWEMVAEPPKFNVRLVILSASMLTLGTFLQIGTLQYVKATLHSESHSYYLIGESESIDSGWTTHSLCQCRFSQLTCSCTEFYSFYSPIIPYEFHLNADSKDGGVNVFLNEILIYNSITDSCIVPTQLEMIDSCVE